MINIYYISQGSIIYLKICIRYIPLLNISIDNHNEAISMITSRASAECLGPSIPKAELRHGLGGGRDSHLPVPFSGDGHHLRISCQCHSYLNHRKTVGIPQENGGYKGFCEICTLWWMTQVCSHGFFMIMVISGLWLELAAIRDFYPLVNGHHGPWKLPSV